MSNTPEDAAANTEAEIRWLNSFLNRSVHPPEGRQVVESILTKVRDYDRLVKVEDGSLAVSRAANAQAERVKSLEEQLEVERKRAEQLEVAERGRQEQVEIAERKRKEAEDGMKQAEIDKKEAERMRKDVERKNQTLKIDLESSEEREQIWSRQVTKRQRTETVEED